MEISLVCTFIGTKLIAKLLTRFLGSIALTYVSMYLMYVHTYVERKMEAHYRDSILILYNALFTSRPRSFKKGSWK